jgi:hypothetical protein
MVSIERSLSSAMRASRSGMAARIYAGERFADGFRDCGGDLLPLINPRSFFTLANPYHS